MIISDFLTRLAQQAGAETLKGAVVLVALDRPVDHIIQRALRFGPYHRGEESPWSHTFLLADAYTGPNTPILDCTIRDQNGAVAWDERIDEILKTGLTHSGGIYSGMIKDYDHPRTTALGVKWVFELKASERIAIVREAIKLQAAGYHYDIPGLLRELARLLIGFEIPAGDKLLFCSAFCQAAYRNALGDKGDFAPGVATDDTTPDDIWFSSLGNGARP